MFSSLFLSIGMMDASVYNNQRLTDEYYRAPSPTTSFATSLSPTLINHAHYTESRPSFKLTFPSGASNILNSTVTDAAGQSLYSISSNSKRTTMVSCTNNIEVATVQWGRHSPWRVFRRSPRMVFRRKKMKCKEWLRQAGPDNESRILTHNDAQFIWMQSQGSASGRLLPANRPDLEIARWQIRSGIDDLVLEVFQETPIETGLLDSIVLSVVLLRSGHALGVWMQGPPLLLVMMRMSLSYN